MDSAPRLGARAERTRGAILEAAEQLFAERGFDATRLDDVAERVGIRRASIVYYFKDKRLLYDAVLESVLGGLYQRVDAALSGPGSLGQRVEAGVTAWVDYVGTRPTLARLLLREVASAGPGRRAEVVNRHARPFTELIREQMFERSPAEIAALNPVDPVHLTATIVGSTVFFVAGMPALLPDRPFDPLTRKQLENHRDELLRIVRRLLGTRGPRRRS